ncbi:MAG: methylenetetrahydrofolate reductase [NAD(P)H] [Epulopiscium sp.]|nr:methylenetetrahydrofolate reductase [NAD(P)H] [Candidatus Epulonipiscium sp.]
MKIKDLFKTGPVISLEIFPPKPDMPIDTIFSTIHELADLHPGFISVTYGAGGSKKGHTVQIADAIQNKYGIETLAHLTCINSTKEEINDVLQRLQSVNVENILALRGDKPQDENLTNIKENQYKYAKNLIMHIQEFGGFSIGAACYPEYHIEAKDPISDLKNLKEKVNSGVDFLITQLFLDNKFFYDFKEKLELMNISVPISAGIMPVINKKQIERITKLCGASIPVKFKRILDKYEDNPSALKEAGIAYATEQIIDLLSSGVDGIHLYTMNRAEVARKIIEPISAIRKHLTTCS